MNPSDETSGGWTPLRLWWSRGWPPALLLVAVTFLAYLPAWQAGFIWDDDVYVTRNPLLTAPDGLKRIWFSLDSPSQYCPLVYTSFRLERPFWGLHPAGYHLVNILLHAINASLVWRLLRRLAVPSAWLAAALFALHPVQVESVAWISERKNVLSLLFYLLALEQWIQFVTGPRNGRWRCYALALLGYALALCSKTTACTLPAALLLVLWLKRLPIDRRRLLQVLPFVLLGLGMGLLTMWWERYHQGTAGKLFALGWLERILIASRAVPFYLGKLLWPANLTFSYPRWTINLANPLAYVWPAALAGLLAVIVAVRRWAGRSVETAAAFYVATLCPLLGFIMLYTFRFSFVADHYQYAASIGPLALAGAALSLAVSPRHPWGAQPPRWVGGLAGGLLLLALGVLTWRQCGIYADAETLWRATLTRNPGSFLAHNNLGTALLRRGQDEEARLHFQAVIRFQPDYEVAYYNLGQVLLRQGQPDAAFVQFQKALELDPNYAHAHNNLANLLAQQGRLREAIAHYEAALQVRPRNRDAANNLAWLLASSPDGTVRNGARAVQLAQQANRLAGGRDPVLLGTLGAAYAETGQFAEAIATAQHALELARLQRHPALAEALSRQLALYRAGSPFRDTARTNAPTAPDNP